MKGRREKNIIKECQVCLNNLQINNYSLESLLQIWFKFFKVIKELKRYLIIPYTIYYWVKVHSCHEICMADHICPWNIFGSYLPLSMHEDHICPLYLKYWQSNMIFCAYFRGKYIWPFIHTSVTDMTLCVYILKVNMIFDAHCTSMTN